MADLNEQLISDNTITGFEKKFLRSFLHDQFPSQFKSTGSRVAEEDREKAREDAALKSKKASYIPPQVNDEGQTQEMLDFYELNKDLFLEQPPHDSDDEHQEEEPAKGKEEDRYAFFKHATAKHPIPTTELVSFTYLKSDPRKFATLTRASKFFKPSEHLGQLKLREMMCLSDYKRLNAIRVRNYIFVLRMITQIDQSEKMRLSVKHKLMQIKKLCVYLELVDADEPEDEEEEDDEENEDEAVDSIKKVYKLIKSDKPIFDLDNEEEAPPVEAGKKKAFQDYEPASEDDDDEEHYEEDEGFDEDREYQHFYKASTMMDNNEEYMQALLHEEAKWIVRATWIEEQIDIFKRNPSTSSWVPWFEAKLTCLRELDIPVAGN